jgi:putative copper export protein
MREKLIRFAGWAVIVTISGAVGLLLLMIGITPQTQIGGFEYGELLFMLFAAFLFILLALLVAVSLAVILFLPLLPPAKKTKSKP